ncbi:restriction endonuclease subunit S [Shewanella algae]|uniref:Type I restriction-modification system restriction endonuclease DNA specificity subunit HsdS n=1 Tax=Shewanella algae TaxID=38313 RepID=A0AAD1KDA3_9GAMM|nr:restriction endonuclease subunit S [Shewanella algae]MBO2668304.1 restriction endonuclease subunit S [Shewanella algae]BCV46813.1 type I restriction-modification system restriction endonuclease DNA specificity subunit HsdS [Shewanella algae]
MSERVPEGWRLRRLSELTELITKGATPSTYGFEYTASLLKNGAKFIRGNNATVNGKFDSHDVKFICGAAHEKLKRSQVKLGDVIVSIVGSVGTSLYVHKGIAPANINQNVALIRPNKELESVFLSHVVVSSIIQDAIGMEATTQAQPSLSLKQVGDFAIPLPPLPEQQKIAKILTSVDEVIEKTQAQIDKLKDLKTGMMQELLTQGVGVDGKPHNEFKDSPVGRIPKGWECLPLEKLLLQKKNSMRSGPFGSALLKDELIPAGYPYLGIDNVHVEYFDKNYKRFVSSEKFEQLNKYAVYEDDVMITIMGTVGRSCVVPKGIGKALSSKHVWTMTFDRNIYLPSLICWQLNFSDWVKKQFRNESQGGVMDSISSKTLKDLWLPVPPINEQKYIKKIYDALMNQIQVKEQVLESKLNLKKALMQDLLTGKVRVQVD